MLLNLFHPAVRRWFSQTFDAPSRVQELGWPVIASGQNSLLLSPTGSGKTLAAFLYAINRLMFASAPAKKDRCRVLYISPLKALAVDVERNLRTPLAGIAALGEHVNLPSVAVRTGDTPSRERAEFNRNPADILITTPESLYLMLTSNARETLRTIESVIVDEIHSVVGTKRGAHLALSLERLQTITGREFQRIGLSATQRPLEEIAEFLGGGDFGPDISHSWQPRAVTIVDAGAKKDLEIQVLSPEFESNDDETDSKYGVMPLLYSRILELIRQHNSTLIFVNSRRLAERMAAALNEQAGADLVKAHHGSVAREQRAQIEEELKAGKLSGLVATSTLELGIDMGAIDLVIQVEAPNSIAIGLQRIGRAGHQQGASSKGILMPKFRGDLLACATAANLMAQGAVEEMQYIRNPLDVLAQQIVAMVAMDDWRLDDLERVVRRSAPFAHLTRSMLENVLDMLSGKYPSADFSDLKPRITWDRITGKLKAREGSRRTAVVNGGTIPDRGLFGVFLAGAEPGKGRVGELDEEMVFETRLGETFFLGASTWRVEEIRHDRVIVSPAPGQQGKMPFWHGESNGRPLPFGLAIGKMIRELQTLQPLEAKQRLITEHQLTETGARNLLAYLQEQKEKGALPDDQTIIIENYIDDFGDLRVCILSTFGGRIHAPWTHAIQALVNSNLDLRVETLWSDDGMIIRFPEIDEPPRLDLLIPDPEEVEQLVLRQIGASPLFASRFREASARALLLPRRYPGQRTPLWHQRKRAADLLQVAAKFESFPMILETYREILRDLFDIPALTKVLEEIRSRKIRTVMLHTKRPSPFASSLMFGYIGNFIYEGDAPLAERRAQALAVDQSQLRELLGEAELRELLDPQITLEWEHQLQALDPEHQAKSVDSLHDVFLRLGDLTVEEIEARCRSGLGRVWMNELLSERRIVQVSIAGELRCIAAEDAVRYHDALGCNIPSDLPAGLMDQSSEPLSFLFHRYGRTHGPFLADDIAARFGLSLPRVLPVLEELEKHGKLVRGEFQRGGSGQEWCETGVLRVIRQKSLARLRQEIEPVEEAAYARFLPDWHRIDGSLDGIDGLLDVLSQLQGYPVPASVFESQILPSRLRNYDPHELDSLLASGQVFWTGVERLGQFDGRIALYVADDAPKLVVAESESSETSELQQAIINFLRLNGASFFPQIFDGIRGGFKQEVIQTLWDLVWSGKIMNDSFLPLRSFLQSKASNRKKKAARTSVPLEAAGRWSLTVALAGEHSPTEKLHALARQLLLRLGIVTREAVVLERIVGGFSAVYPTLKIMEEAGRVRRGYFISGRGAAQFGEVGAIERLRSVREPGQDPIIHVLAATDPANPYGATLPWPERPERQQAGRFAGARVILVNGQLAAYFGKGERSILTFFQQEDPLAEKLALGVSKALGSLVDSGRKRAVLISDIDGAPAEKSFLYSALKAEGFQAYSHGLHRRRREVLEK